MRVKHLVWEQIGNTYIAKGVGHISYTFTDMGRYVLGYIDSGSGAMQFDNIVRAKGFYQHLHEQEVMDYFE